jgi:hypothetical protein
MSSSPDEDVLTKEIETWHEFDKFPSDRDKTVFATVLNNYYYKYSVAKIIT